MIGSPVIFSTDVPTKNRRDRQEDKEGEWPIQSRSEQVQLVT